MLYASLLSGFFLNPSQKAYSGGALDGVGMLLNELLFAYDFEQLYLSSNKFHSESLHESSASRRSRTHRQRFDPLKGTATFKLDAHHVGSCTRSSSTLLAHR